MAWSASKIFSALPTDALNNTAALDLGADVLKAALYNNSITPDQTVTSANTAYNAGQWANTNEVSDSTNWPAGGEALGSVTSGFTTNVYKLAAANTSSTTSTATLASVYGSLVYDSTLSTPVAGQGVCFNYFGGSNSVTSGTFTIVWNASGILTLTL